MRFSKSSLLSILAITSRALACVDFSANIEWPWYPDCPLDAALTDNGHQKCAIIHEKGHCFYGIWRIFTVPDVDVPMTCVEGYSASFNLKSGVVKYWYSGFEGSFTTGYAPYWSAKVWGC